MKRSSKKGIMLLSLMCISTSAMADFRDREMGERYRNQHKRMDICAEIKEDLAAAESAYDNAEAKVRTANKAISSQRNQVTSKERTLGNLQSIFNKSSASYTTLSNKQKRKPQLLKVARQEIATVQAKIPAAQADLNAKHERKKKKCKGLRAAKPSCWNDAKPKYEKAKKHMANLNQQVARQQASIKELGTIDAKVARAKRALDNSTTALNAEQSAQPTLGGMRTMLQRLIAKRDQNNSGYAKVEARYGRLEVRAEKCMKMQYDAKKASTFKDSLLAFAADNGQGCEEGMSRINSTRGRAQKDGVNEAYELVCNSDVLTREIVREVEVQVPGEPLPPVQCSDTNTGNDDNYPRTEYINLRDTFSTGNPYASDHRSDRRDGKGELKKVLSEPGAKMIKLDIANIDVEAGYDFVIILDAQGNEIAKLTNSADDRGNEQAYGSYSTGWVQGDTLTVMLYSDGRGERSGFEIEGFEVQM
jgi:hypothetical protein